MVASGAPSAGHCNTMGTALSMNSVAEALGMSLPGCAAIPGPHRDRYEMAYWTGRRIVEMIHEDLRPSKVMTRKAFENAIVASSALGASTNCPPHVTAIARHMGVELDIRDWDRIGYAIPLLTNLMPAGEYLGEEFHRAGGVPGVMNELLQAGKLHADAMTVSGKTVGEAYGNTPVTDRRVIKAYDAPMQKEAGFAVLSGNLFDAAVMKTSPSPRYCTMRLKMPRTSLAKK
jgi:dihydroxy-acid dehydratase